jgi:hypothetical protein
MRPAPVERPRPVGKPAPAAKGPIKGRPVEKGRPAPRPQVDPDRVARITIARTAAEQAAVLSALQGGKRFAVVGNGTVIDTQTNRMWAARCGSITPYRGAQSQVRNLRLANYADWRLPAPEEVSALAADGGSGQARSLGLFSPERGGKLEWLWTARSRRRFWLFRQEAICLSLITCELGWRAARAEASACLAVRSAA